MTASTEGRDETLEAWHHEVAGVLAKARKKDVSEMPADAWRTLETTTLDDIVVEPLYTRRDELAEAAAPGQFPFVRGGAGATGRPGWLIAPRVDAQTSSAQVQDDLAGGVTALWITGGGDVAGLLEAAQGVPVAFCGVDLATARAALQRGQVLALGATPLTNPLNGGQGMSLEEGVQLAQESGDVPVFTVNGLAFHELGASDTQELGWALAAGVAYVKALTEAGLPVADALRKVSFRYAATDDQFTTIAKLRAARLTWARVAEAFGAPESGSALQHAVTSRAMMSRRDPYVNMLRSTIAAFAAGVGGADVVTVLDFDEQIPGGWPGLHDGFAERMSRNVSLILLEESHLGHVIDPAGGSWYVESLTDQIAAKAWEIFQGMEKDGGFATAVESGALGDAAKALADKRFAAIAKRKLPVTGVSEFPNLGEAPLPKEARGESTVVRYGAQFEAMRDRSDAHLEETGQRPTVLLAPIGTVAEHNVRVTFTSNLLASGGIDSRNPGQLKPGEGDFDAQVKQGGEKIAVLCSTDKIYTEQGAAAVEALRQAGIETVYLAGAEASFEGVEGAGRPDGFLNMRINAVEALQALLTQLGVK